MRYDYDKIRTADNLRVLMDENGYSLRSLSDKTGLHYQTIFSITSGKAKPNLENTIILCNTFDCPIEYFLFKDLRKAMRGE